MIISATDTNKLQEIINAIYELKNDDLESLWDWFNHKTIVGGMIVDLPETQEEINEKISV